MHRCGRKYGRFVRRPREDGPGGGFRGREGRADGVVVICAVVCNTVIIVTAATATAAAATTAAAAVTVITKVITITILI